jgi:hypothetical protein
MYIQLGSSKNRESLLTQKETIQAEADEAAGIRPAHKSRAGAAGSDDSADGGSDGGEGTDDNGDSDDEASFGISRPRRGIAAAVAEAEDSDGDEDEDSAARDERLLNPRRKARKTAYRDLFFIFLIYMFIYVYFDEMSVVQLTI